MDLTSVNQYLPGAIAVVCYLLTAALLWRSVTDPASPARKRTVLIGLIALAAVALHGITLFTSVFQSAQLNFSFFNSLSVTTWITTALLLLVSIFRPVLSLGLIVFPISALVLASALLVNSPAPLSVQPELQWHVLFSVVAYALLTMAAVQSLLVALQDKRLRSHRPAGFLRTLPALKLMEQVLLQLLMASFAVLSLALITGFIFLDDLFAQRLVHKTILSLIALILLGVLLLGHFRFGWRGQKAARMTLGAYLALLLGYFGSKFVKELLLS